MPSPLSSVHYKPAPSNGSRLQALAIQLPDAKPMQKRDRGALTTELGDGSLLVNLNPSAVAGARPQPDKHDANLALSMDDAELSRISSELLQGIARDEQSSAEWRETYAEGIKLLGFVIEDSRGDVGTSSAPLEGMSRFYHPLLAEAVLLFGANARGELLPAAGPVKVRDDQATKQSVAPSVPVPPIAPSPPAGIGHNGGSPLGLPPGPPSPLVARGPMLPNAPAPPVPSGAGAAPPPTNGVPSPPGVPLPAAAPAIPPQLPAAPDRAVLANALEKDLNHYLTVTAAEYVPDTDQMLIKVGFGGKGIKKVYNCPIRRRPVSESVPIEDFIVSNALTDLSNAARITHRSKMRPAMLKRLQILGVYREVNVGDPVQSEQPSAIEQVKAEVAGVQPQVADPRDADYTILECYCELVIDEFAPKKFKGKQLPLPYRVTIDKDSERILDVRRNWREDDEQCLAKEFFVEFPFVKAFGFYGIGLLHILGNTTKALTAMTRESIDLAMFHNFPGFIYAKGAGRQVTNQFRVAPGTGIGLDVGLQSLKDSVMPLPYPDLSQGFVALQQNLLTLGQRLGGTANINVCEGRQDAPVGTTLALIEQATRQEGAVMKRLMSAQAKEFQLLADRFRDDPEAITRFNKRPAMQWEKEQFRQALNDFNLVPVADPNNPTALHRKIKANALKQVATEAPALFNLRKTVIGWGDMMEMHDIEDYLNPDAPPQGPQLPPVDPAKMAQVQATIHGKELDAQAKQAQSALELQRVQLEMQDRAAERESRIKVAQINENTERLRLAATLSIHADKTDAAREALTMKIGSEHLASAYDQEHDRAMQAAEQAHQAGTQARDQLHEVMTAPPAGPQTGEQQ